MISVSVSVTTAATVLHVSTNASMRDPQPIRIYNNGTQTIFIGGASVTAATGSPVVSTGSVEFQFTTEETLSAVVTASTADVRVLRGRTT
jgi:hypothetical protein